MTYRYKLLGTSRAKAQKYGMEGAMYPWEGAWLEDGETCPCLGDMDLETGERRPNQMGEKEVHINADIAYAVWQYYTVTGDEAFMRDYGNEIILSTAAFWLSRAEKRNGRYEILDVIGPDEYKENIDNNAYTNYMAHFNLWLAREILKKLSQEERDTLNRRLALEKLEEGLPEVLELLYLPVPDVDGILPQFDGFRNLKDFRCEKYKTLEKVGMIFRDYPFEEIKNMQICKQADNIMLFYTLSGQFDSETKRKNFEYYEQRTLHDSSLSACIHSVAASRIGMPDAAEQLFRSSCGVDLGEQSDNSDNGIHAASIGGIWLGVVMGFGGVRMEEDVLCLDPVLPRGIQSYSFPLTYRGTHIRVTVNGQGCTVVRQSGPPIPMRICGRTETVR